MAYTSTKVDGVDTLPASEYNNLITHVFRDVMTKTGNYTASAGDIILGNGTITITMPASHSSGDLINIKNISSNTVTIAGNGSTMDGDISYTMQFQYESVALISDGSNWHLI